MMEPTKKLAVAYGNFACVIEGFDDPFPVMRDVVDHFAALNGKAPTFADFDADADFEDLPAKLPLPPGAEVSVAPIDGGVHIRRLDPASDEPGDAGDTAPAPGAGAAAMDASDAVDDPILAQVLKAADAAMDAADASPDDADFEADDLEEITEEVTAGLMDDGAFAGDTDDDLEDDDPFASLEEMEAAARRRAMTQEAEAAAAEPAFAATGSEDSDPAQDAEADQTEGAAAEVEAETDQAVAALAADDLLFHDTPLARALDKARSGEAEDAAEPAEADDDEDEDDTADEAVAPMAALAEAADEAKDEDQKPEDAAEPAEPPARPAALRLGPELQAEAPSPGDSFIDTVDEVPEPQTRRPFRLQPSAANAEPARTEAPTPAPEPTPAEADAGAATSKRGLSGLRMGGLFNRGQSSEPATDTPAAAAPPSQVTKPTPSTTPEADDSTAAKPRLGGGLLRVISGGEGDSTERPETAEPAEKPMALKPSAADPEAAVQKPAPVPEPAPKEVPPAPVKAVKGGNDMAERLHASFATSNAPEPVALDDTILDGADDDPSSPAGFAKRVGANTLPTFMAAAAGYMTIMERRERITRADIMTVTQQITGNSKITAEAKVKAFGKLVRNGDLVRAEAGQFALSGERIEEYEDRLGIEEEA